MATDTQQDFNIVSSTQFIHNGTIYHTTYKKNGIVNQLHFSHNGDLNSAVEKVKQYLSKHHLKHIHTVQFLVNLDETLENDGY
jgi:hypothetical protein